MYTAESISDFLTPTFWPSGLEKPHSIGEGRSGDKSAYFAFTKYSVHKGDPSVKTKHIHRILFSKSDTFTYDGTCSKWIDDPENASFLKSLKEHKCPEEFPGDGIHVICMATKLEKEKARFLLDKIEDKGIVDQEEIK